MSGTSAGGQAARDRNRKLYGDDYYARIGSIGGKKGHTGGFSSNAVGKDGLTGRQRARIAGSKGGKKSQRVWTPEQRRIHAEIVRKEGNNGF